MFGSLFSVFTLGLALVGQISQAAPTLEIESRQAITTVSAATISALTPYGQFSRAAYCGVTSTWTCGAACTALPGFVVYAYGGDGNAVPKWYVGYWPTGNTAVVVHEGTDPTQFLSLLTDADALFASLSTTLFPGISSAIKVHGGFGTAQAASATAVLAAVKQVLAAHSITHVTLVGHSLGAAISTIDGIYLKLALPSTTTFKHVLHGSPRVGNQQFADYIDANFSDFTRINHTEDPIPIVPGRFLGYVHAYGESHIDDSGVWYACPGQDNTSTDCSTGDVPNILESDILDHLGPYNGVWIGTIFC